MRRNCSKRSRAWCQLPVGYWVGRGVLHRYMHTGSLVELQPLEGGAVAAVTDL